MFAQSAAQEDDAGTLYPTAMHDTNGNYDHDPVPGRTGAMGGQHERADSRDPGLAERRRFSDSPV